MGSSDPGGASAPNPERPTSEQLEKELRRVWLKQETLKALWGAVRTLIIFAAVAVLLSTLLFPVLRVQKGSMTPTLQEGELLVFSSVGKISRGDIIAFHYNNQVLIKRVIAVPGDRIELASDGAVILNGMRLTESYVSELARGECTIEMPLQVPANRYFVLGDHRMTSLDSRLFEIGLIKKEQIVGKAILRFWPIAKLGLL